jgi:hypothetical protein
MVLLLLPQACEGWSSGQLKVVYRHGPMAFGLAPHCNIVVIVVITIQMNDFNRVKDNHGGCREASYLVRACRRPSRTSTSWSQLVSTYANNLSCEKRWSFSWVSTSWTYTISQCRTPWYVSTISNWLLLVFYMNDSGSDRGRWVVLVL